MPNPAIKALDRDFGQPGIMGTPFGSSSFAITANRMYARRICPSRRMRIIKIGFAVETQSGTDDPCDVGIFSADLATLIVSAGATTGKLNSTGPKSIAIATTFLLPKTVYYLAFAANSTATLSGESSGGPNGSQIYGTAPPYIEWGTKNTAYPLAAPGTTLAGNLQCVRLVGLEV